MPSILKLCKPWGRCQQQNQNQLETRLGIRFLVFRANLLFFLHKRVNRSFTIFKRANHFFNSFKKSEKSERVKEQKSEEGKSEEQNSKLITMISHFRLCSNAKKCYTYKGEKSDLLILL